MLVFRDALYLSLLFTLFGTSDKAIYMDCGIYYINMYTYPTCG